MPRQAGFTLIEVMVAVVVLAIGLLGLAGLQATSLRFNSSAYFRSQATNLAYDMADRMRVNRQAAFDGDYDPEAFESPPPACAVGVVDPTATLAVQDVQAWRNALACTLPLGTGSITRNGDVFTITVRWDDRRESDGDPDDPPPPPLEFVMDTGL